MESVEMAFSVDAAAMTDGTSHIFAALKNIDPRPHKNGELLYVEIDEDGKQKIKSLQSKMCFLCAWFIHVTIKTVPIFFLRLVHVHRQN